MVWGWRGVQGLPLGQQLHPRTPYGVCTMHLVAELVASGLVTAPLWGMHMCSMPTGWLTDEDGGPLLQC